MLVIKFWITLGSKMPCLLRHGSGFDTPLTRRDTTIPLFLNVIQALFYH